MKSAISRNTIVQYIEYLKDAYIINEANRFDVKGRKYIGTPLKYYFEDLGLRNARLGGFLVDVGVVESRTRDQDGRQKKRKLEIDFVANMGSRRYYIQSAFQIPDQDKERQEKDSLNNIDDSFKKIVLVKDVVKTSRDEKGIVTMSIFDFLLSPSAINF